MQKWLKEYFSKPLPYWVGGVILGTINIILFWTTGEALRVSGGVASAISSLASCFNIDTSQWHYFQARYGTEKMDNIYLLLIIGLVIGALLGALVSNQWRIRKFKKAHVTYAVIGGILMGFGARLATGCNLGALFSAIPSFSLHGWVFWAFLFVGAYIGNKILMRNI